MENDKITSQRRKTVLCSGKSSWHMRRLFFVSTICNNHLFKLQKRSKNWWFWLILESVTFHLPCLAFQIQTRTSYTPPVLVGSWKNSPQPASHLAVVSTWWCHESLAWSKDGDLRAAQSPIMENNSTPHTHALLIWWILSSQIGHKFWTWSRKCQEKGEKQRDKFVQGDGGNNDEHVIKERWIEREKY